METPDFDKVYDSLEFTEGRFHQYHKRRYIEIFKRLPIGLPEEKILDVGACNVTTKLLEEYSAYGLIVGVTHPSYRLSIKGNRIVNIQADLDSDKIEDATIFDQAICTEMLEHCAKDPMNVLQEINTHLKIGGQLLFSVPNICSVASLQKILSGSHPQLTATYDPNTHNRHNREYTPVEVKNLLSAAGFEIIQFDTIDCWPFQKRIKIDLPNGGGDIMVVARKISEVKDRFPNWLYHAKKATS